MIEQKHAPAGAVAPQIIEHDGLFKLDVDNDIWQDLGLDDEHDGTPPLWLSNESVREGIKAMLEYDRCVEEEIRLMKERCAMQEWMMEEWACVEHTKDLLSTSFSLYSQACTNSCCCKIWSKSQMSFISCLQEDDLCRLCVT